MNHHLIDNGIEFKQRDVVYTNRNIAKSIIDRYNLTGSILDPCKGDGAFYEQIPNALWCEIQEGRDFFFNFKIK